MEFIRQIVTTELMTFTAGLWTLLLIMILVSILKEGDYGKNRR